MECSVPKTFVIEDKTEASPFKFKVPGESKVRSLPSLQCLPVGIKVRLSEVVAPIQRASELGREPSAEVNMELVKFQIELIDKYQPGLPDLLTEDMLVQLMTAWAEHSNISVGE
nr:MAG TPA: hypothetical protein [Caudoviricetes sp.]